MPPKQPIKNQKAPTGYKQGLPPRDVLPSQIKAQPREGKQLKIPEVSQSQVPQLSLFEEFQKIDEWPGDDQAKQNDFNINSHNLYSDQQFNPQKLTESFSQEISNLIFWRRPTEYINSEIQEVAKIESKFTFKRRQSQLTNLGNNSFDSQYKQQEFSNSPQKIKPIQEDIKLEIKVFQPFQREETPEEMEIRKKEQQAERERQELQKKMNKRAPPPKKEEVIEQGPILINDVRLSNMDLSINYPSDSKWIASQFQLIKDRNIHDCYTNKPIWTKIYPQQQGIPAYNNSGKYWIKLYYMGKERKIEIDDKMPVNYKGECLFPRSVKKEEIWSCLFTKAIFKLISMSFDLKNLKSLAGSGFIMYALTGLLSQSIPLEIQNSNELLKNQLRELLADNHYKSQDVFVTCYSDSIFDANQQKQKKQKQLQNEQQRQNHQKMQMMQFDENNDSFTRKRNTTTVVNRAHTQLLEYQHNILQFHEEFKDENEEEKFQQERRKNPAVTLFQQVSEKLNINKNQEKPTYVIPGFSYPIIESFHNDQFNMVYVQKRSDKEIKLRQEYIELSNMPVNKMNKDQKIEHRKKKKEIKDKIAEEDKKRIELITHPPIQYNFYRIKTGVSKVPLLNMFSPFSFEEIHIAKICLSNKLQKPPNYQDGADLREDGKSLMSSIQKNNAEESLQMKPLEDFSSIPNIIEPLNRGLGGLWVSDIDYLTEYEGFQVKSFNIEYPAFEKNKYLVLFRFGISQCQQEEIFILKIKSQNDNQLLKYMHLKLVEQDHEGNGLMLTTIEGVDKNLYENTLNISNYMRLQLKPKTSYHLVLEGELPHNIPEGSLQIDFYVKNNELQFENYENIEPLVYQEKYLPTKYGILFREKLYVNDDVLVSLRLKIAEVIGNQVQQQTIDPKKKGKGPNVNNTEQNDLQEKDLTHKRLIRMELFENGKSIIYSQGHNITHFTNILLKSTKNDERQYLLQATFDLRDWPEAKLLNEDTENIYWFLTVFSTQTVAFVKDTDKEDREKAIKKSWEDKEPGRAEKAKKARRKYEILLKKQHNPQIELTEEENQLINEQRLSKKQRDEQQQQQQQTGAGAKKPPPKKEEKKPVKGAKKEEVVEEKKEIKVFPLSKQHQTNEICQFLEHMEKPRVSEKLAEHGGLIDIRSQENKQEIKENAHLSQEEYLSFNQRSELLKNQLKQLQNEETQKILSQYQRDRTSFKENWHQFIEQREEIKSKVSLKNQKEKELIEILKQEKPTITATDFEKLLNDLSEVHEFNAAYINLGKKLLKNLKIQALSDKMNECLNTFNIETLKECMEDYKKYQVSGINQEIVQKAEEMIEEAKLNPNFVAEKQAEAKKQGKKGKK